MGPAPGQRVGLLFSPPALLGLLLAATAGPAALGQRWQTVDLAEVSTEWGALERILGAKGNGGTGVPLAAGHDCDGDGIQDYAVAFLTAEFAGRPMAGEVDLVLGDGVIHGAVDTARARADVLRIGGAGARETAGNQIWMDDVTGDGVGDLLVARQNHSPDPQRLGAGALTVIVGGPELRLRAEESTPLDLGAEGGGIARTTFLGAAALDRLGIWVRTGDVDGDGVADVLVGADQEDLEGEENRGAVYLIRGGAHLASAGVVDLRDFGDTPLAGHVARITPPPGSAGYHFGATCLLADLDGNGRAEVLASAALFRSGAGISAEGAPSGSAEAAGGSPRGTVYVAWDDNFPSGGWPPGFSFSMDDPPGSRTVLDGGARSVKLGEELLGGQDYDGDGEADLLVADLVADGSEGQDRPASGTGHLLFRAALLKGLTVDLDHLPSALPTTLLLGPEALGIGGDTATHGDFDGDGSTDLFFASPHANPAGRTSAGVGHVLFGGRPWPARVDLAPGARPGGVRLSEIRGARGTVGSDQGDTIAYTAVAADVDGDGTDDLLFNEMFGNGVSPAAVDVGNLVVLSLARMERVCPLGVPAAAP